MERVGITGASQSPANHTEMTEVAALKQQLDRIERKLSVILGEQKKKSWVKAGDVMRVTGWNKEKLRQMRVNGLIEFKNDDGFFYNPDSIHKMFLKATT